MLLGYDAPALSTHEQHMLGNGLDSGFIGVQVALRTRLFNSHG